MEWFSPLWISKRDIAKILSTAKHILRQQALQWYTLPFPAMAKEIAVLIVEQHLDLAMRSIVRALCRIQWKSVMFPALLLQGPLRNAFLTGRWK